MVPIVEYIDSLLVSEAKKIHGSLNDGDLIIDIDDVSGVWCNIRGKTMLRTMCARLGVLAGGSLVGTLYGGEGTIGDWKLNFMNTPGEQYFTLTKG